VAARRHNTENRNQKRREELVTAKYAENRREFNRKERIDRREKTPQALVFVLLAFFVVKDLPEIAGF